MADNFKIKSTKDLFPLIQCKGIKTGEVVEVQEGLFKFKGINRGEAYSEIVKRPIMNKLKKFKVKQSEIDAADKAKKDAADKAVKDAEDKKIKEDADKVEIKKKNDLIAEEKKKQDDADKADQQEYDSLIDAAIEMEIGTKEELIKLPVEKIKELIAANADEVKESIEEDESNKGNEG